MAGRIIAGVCYKSAFRSECPNCLCARVIVLQIGFTFVCMFVCVCKRKIEKMRACVCVSVCACTPERAHGNGSST